MRFFNRRISTDIAKVAFSTLFVIFIISFTSVQIVNMEFFALILFVYVLICIEKKEDVNLLIDK